MSRRSLLLIGSLALNLLLAAAFATHLWREHWRLAADDAAMPDALAARTAADSLSDKRRAVRGSFAELRRAQARAAAALRREPLDRAELEAAFAALERARADHARRSHELLLELALRLDREGRHHLARRLEQERAIHPGRGRGSRGKAAAGR